MTVIRHFKIHRILLFMALLSFNAVNALSLLIPMDKQQKNHLKAYGLAYWTLQNGLEIHWLLNYRGGSFLLPYHAKIEEEALIRNITFRKNYRCQSPGHLARNCRPTDKYGCRKT
ncbi:MAG: hypothetical protein KatS3mg034_1960 [Vicingaceae bacterium]|nr:MAG: hypothetical protein KatS3mg034_1960 [Vicingaceae bacterium]